MSDLLLFGVGIVVLCISSFLFKFAAGSLSITKLNIISFTFYSLLVFSFLGALLIVFGFKDHYMVEKISDRQTIRTTFFWLSYVMISLPVLIILFSRVFIGKHIQKRYDEYLAQSVVFEKTESTALLFVILFSLLGLMATSYMFINIGSIPLITMLFRRVEVSDTLRIDVTRNYTGNMYIRNIIVLTITPLISYVCYIYARITHKHKTTWLLLFIINAIVAILIKTYNLEKAPLLYWFLNFYLIEIIIGNRKIKKVLLIILVFVIILLFLMYLIGGYSGSLLSLSSGPLSRILITQSSTLFLHVQAFPAEHEFLAGKSLPTAVAWLAGAEESWIRSGRIVMEIYNPKGVASGEAGVMNAMFMGEVYANWGIKGILVSPVFVAFPLSISFALLIRNKKTPLMIVLYIALLSTFIVSLQGGFIDFIYNTNVILFVFITVAVFLVAHKGIIRIKRGIHL